MGIADSLVRALARRRLSRLVQLAKDPREAQEALRRRLLERSKHTAFGRHHGLERVRSYADQRAAIPLGTYADRAPWLQRAREGEPDVIWPGAIRAWAVSSGTTSGEKYLPVTRESIRSHQRGGFDLVAPWAARPEASVFAGKSLFLGGSTQLRKEGAAWIGDNTGIQAREIPRVVQRFRLPSAAIASLGVWEEKIARAAAEALDEDVRLLAGVPSWVLLFGERVLKAARERGLPAANLKALWPQLQLLAHGGCDFAPYRRRFEELAGPGVACLDSYSASEGGMLAVQDRIEELGMLPLADRGVFFEFVPREELGQDAPARVLLHEVETGVEYAVAVTTDAGLCSYLVGDLVRFVSRDPLRLLFAGRVAHTLNSFGEHVSGGELEVAIQHAAEVCGVRVAEFAVTTRLGGGLDQVGNHHYFVELEAGSLGPEEGAFAGALDRRISAGNDDYTVHRSYGLNLPSVEFVPPGTFLAWMKARGAWGGQHKVPRVLSEDLAQSLSDTARDAGSSRASEPRLHSPGR